MPSFGPRGRGYGDVPSPTGWNARVGSGRLGPPRSASAQERERTSGQARARGSRRQRCVGCDENNSAWSPAGQLCPAHRHRPEQQTPQGLGAFAAFERDDQAATLGRFPVVFPTSEVTKRDAPCKQAAASFTHRAAGTATSVATLHSIPPRSTGSVPCSRTVECRRTCSRTAVRGCDVPGARTTAASISRMSCICGSGRRLVSALRSCAMPQGRVCGGLRTSRAQEARQA